MPHYLEGCKGVRGGGVHGIAAQSHSPPQHNFETCRCLPPAMTESQNGEPSGHIIVKSTSVSLSPSDGSCNSHTTACRSTPRPGMVCLLFVLKLLPQPH